MEEKKLIGSLKLKTKICLALIAVLIIGLAIGYFTTNYFKSSAKATSIGFEDIGELNTQETCCAVIGVAGNARKLFDIDIPFTESKCIYTYDVIVQAGLDFDKIKWKEAGEKIKVTMPEIHVTNSYLKEDSLEIYLEKESIFNNISFSDINETNKKLIETGVEKAKESGLYDYAKKNAEKIIRSFFVQHKEYKDKEFVFTWK